MNLVAFSRNSVVLIMSLIASGAATQADPVVIYETSDPFGSFLGVNGADVFINQSVAVRFTPADDYSLFSLGLWLWNNDGSGASSPITLSVRPEMIDPIVGPIPSDQTIEVWDVSVPFTGQFQPQLFTFESVQTPLLEAGVNYWVVAESDSPPLIDPVWAFAGQSTGFATFTNFSTGEWQQAGNGAVPATVVLGEAPTAGEETFVETFDNQSNEGGWSWGNINESILPDGGNPGAHLFNTNLIFFFPTASIEGPAPNQFTGDYRARGVTAIGIDLLTEFVTITVKERPVSLLLVYDNGTPEVEDDTAAFFVGPQNAPFPGQGWVSYDFVAPAQETELPAGWQLLNLGDSGSPAIHTWNEVITNVTDVRFQYGDPTLFFILQGWMLGLDNPRITTAAIAPACPADLDGDGVVNGADLASQLSSWGVNSGSGDLNGDGLVNGADLASLLSSWGACAGN